MQQVSADPTDQTLNFAFVVALTRPAKPVAKHVMGLQLAEHARPHSHPRQVTVELNKGEARNALARAVCFHRLGRLRDRATKTQQYRASGLATVTAAIALWNTVYLGRALDDLRRGGEIIPDPLLAHLAPVGWQHINLTGDYLWDADTHLAPDGFRQLRAPAAITAHAA